MKRNNPDPIRGIVFALLIALALWGSFFGGVAVGTVLP